MDLCNEKWGFQVKSNMTLRIHYWLRLNVFISVRKWTLFLTFLKISKIFAPDVNDLFLKILTVKQMIQPTLKQAITTHFLSLSPFRNSTWLPCSEIFQLIQKWHKVTHFDTIIYPFHGYITRINFKHSFDSRQKLKTKQFHNIKFCKVFSWILKWTSPHRKAYILGGKS